MNKSEHPLDRFVRTHREAFDDRDAPADLWSAIEGRLPQPQAKVRSIRTYQWISAAAVALVLILSGVIAGMHLSKPDYQTTAEYKDFQKAELFFASQIDDKMDALEKLPSDPVVEEDLQQLDIVYKELKSQLTTSENPNKQAIIDAMIVNYQTRIAILETVLEKLTESQQYQKTQSSDEDEFENM